MPIPFRFSSLEKRRILFWADEDINEAFHWGDGSAYLPEEGMMLDKFNSADEELSLSNQEVRILWQWMQHGIMHGELLTGEDIVAGRKVVSVYEGTFGPDAPELKEVKKMLGI